LEKNKEDVMRDFILDRSESLFTRYGYKNTSVDKIAEHCQISKPTLYNYFKSKNSLFLALFSRFQDGLAAKARELMGQDKDKYQIIEEIIDLSLQVIQEKRNFLRMLIMEHHMVVHECDDFEEHMNLGLRRREEVSRSLGEFMKDIARPEVIEEFGIVMVGTSLSNLLEGAFWDSIKGISPSHEKQKKLIMVFLRNGILA
jgi:AcrR family transcriptional regulator